MMHSLDTILGFSTSRSDLSALPIGPAQQSASVNNIPQRTLTAVLLATTASCYLIASPALAQADQGTAPAESENQGNIQEIVVTAQKRAQNLQDVPISITAVTAGDLSAAGATGTADLNVAVPGLNFANGVGNGLPYIRGVGTQDNAPGNENAVSMYMDNIYLPAASTSIFEFSDVERVEVLRGPQGTLFGRNASGGVIHVITRDPSFSGAEANWSIGYGNYDTKTADAYVSLPLSDTVAINAAATYSDQGDAYGKSVITGEPVGEGGFAGIRSKLRWEDDSSEATLGFSYNERSGSFGVAWRPVDPVTPGLGYYDTEADSRGYTNKGKHTLVYLNAAHDFGGVELRSISAYQDVKAHIKGDIDGLPSPLIYFDIQLPQEFITQEFQLSSTESGPLHYTAGLYYFHSKASASPRKVTGIPFGGPNSTLMSNGTQTTNSYAAYGQATYDFSEGTSVTAGLRYTYDKRSFVSDITLADGTFIQQPASYDNNSSGGKLTWRLALNQEFAPHIMGYVSYNRGFKSGVYNITALTPTPTNPETLDAYEVGLKSTFLGGDARLNLSAFYYDYKDMQVQGSDNAGNQVLANSSSARIYGMELETEIAPTSNFRIFGNLAWTPKAEYRDFTNAPDGNGGFFDASGNRLIRTPKFTGSIGAEFNVPTSIGEFVLNGNYYYNSGWIPEADGLLEQDSYDLVNGSLTYNIPGDEFYVQLWGKNLTKTKYASDILNVAVPLYTPADPRTYGIKIGARF